MDKPIPDSTSPVADHGSRFYEELAVWWPLISPPEEYAEEAETFRRLFDEYATTPIRTVLELGSGGGNNASFLKAHYELTLTDLSPAMLEISRALNPECQHIQGDMRTLRLGETFDGVFVHDAIGYMTSEADLRAALETAYLHLRPGGVALFVPDYVSETFVESTSHHGSDGDDRAVRYLEWAFDPDPADSTFTTIYTFVLRDPDGTIHVEHDQHTLGLFSREVWLRLLRDVGFEPERVVESYGRDVFIGRKPSD